MSDDHMKLREEVRAKLAAWVQPTFRHDGDPDPHPDEDALVDRLTDGVVLPYELKFREVLAEVDQLRSRVEHLDSARDSAVRAWKSEHEAADELQRELGEARADLELLRANPPGRGFLAQAYANGWHDAIAAYRAPGWAEREASRRKYLAEVDADGPWIVAQQAEAADAPQQPEPSTRRSVLLAAIQREGGDWSPLRARTALVNAGHPVESNRAHEIMKTLAASGFLEQVRPRAYTYRLKTEAPQQSAQDGEVGQ